MKAAGIAIGIVLTVLALLVGALMLTAGAVAMEAEQAPIPPELEAAYRQVGARAGVHWAALAAWDGATGFSLPLPTVDDIFAERVADRLEQKRDAAEAWCAAHPEDHTACPPEPPELTHQETQALWRNAHAAWRQLLVRYIEAHAAVLTPVMGEFERNPEAVFTRSLGGTVATRAAELFEGYHLLDTLAADADEILVVAPTPPTDWVPVDGFAWPLIAPITSRFGMRISPIDGAQRLHAGVDLGIGSGNLVRASRAGTVAQAEWSDVYGWVVLIDHGDGYTSLYAHNAALAVSPGQQVEQGQVISASGSTGWSTGPHLHFEIHYHGAPVDPLLLLSQRSGRD